MTRLEMRGYLSPLVACLTEQQILNYMDHFEKGKVREYVDPAYCVAACLINSIHENVTPFRSNRYANEADDNPCIRAIESGYRQAQRDVFEPDRKAEATFQLVLYQLCQEGGHPRSGWARLKGRFWSMIYPYRQTSYPTCRPNCGRPR